MIGQKMLFVKLGQLRTVELSQESERTILHHMVIALALIGGPNEVRRNIRLPAEAGSAQLVCFFSGNFQLNAVSAQRLQFFFYAHVSSSLMRPHSFPSSASTVFMAAESNLHARSSRSIRANTSGKHSISSWYSYFAYSFPYSEIQTSAG